MQKKQSALGVRGWTRTYSPAPSLSPPSLCSLLDTSTRRALERRVPHQKIVSSLASEHVGGEAVFGLVTRILVMLQRMHTL